MAADPMLLLVCRAGPPRPSLSQAMSAVGDPTRPIAWRCDRISTPVAPSDHATLPVAELSSHRHTTCISAPAREGGAMTTRLSWRGMQGLMACRHTHLGADGLQAADGRLLLRRATDEVAWFCSACPRARCAGTAPRPARARPVSIAWRHHGATHSPLSRFEGTSTGMNCSRAARLLRPVCRMLPRSILLRHGCSHGPTGVSSRAARHRTDQ